MNLAIYSESNNILSFRSYFQPKGGTFFETPDSLLGIGFVQILTTCVYEMKPHSQLPWMEKCEMFKPH